jgi:hypothetical protein
VPFESEPLISADFSEAGSLWARTVVGIGPDTISEDQRQLAVNDGSIPGF